MSDTIGVEAGETGPNQPPPSEVVTPNLSKTPMYQAINAARYQRQALIRATKKRTGRDLICYVSGGNAGIDRDDTMPVADLLHNVVTGQNLDLLLHTPGGDINATEKLCVMIRDRVEKGELRVIVPDFAKSAGTLVALGADWVVMGETSELGPIDPQIGTSDGKGNTTWHSVKCYVDSYNAFIETITKDPNNVEAQIMLGKFDPSVVTHYRQVLKRAQQLAESQLRLGMFRNGGGNFTKIPADLLDTQQWPTHGQMIGWQDATVIGLHVTHMKSDDPVWQMYWQIYCQQRLAVRDNQKLFESDCVSLCIEGMN